MGENNNIVIELMSYSLPSPVRVMTSMKMKMKKKRKRRKLRKKKSWRSTGRTETRRELKMLIYTRSVKVSEEEIRCIFDDIW